MTDPDTTPPRPQTTDSLITRLTRPDVAALAISIVALILAAAPYFTTGGQFGQRVRGYLLANPELLQEMSMALQTREQSMAVDQINEAAAANAALLAPDPRDPAIGPEDAAVTVIEFFDYRCPGCKAVSPEFLQITRANPDVRFIFKEWPILDRGDETVSNYAARAALAANAQGRYLPVHQALMATPSLSIETIDRALEANGVDLARARAHMAAPATDQHIADIHILAETLRLQGTPTFLVNGQTTNGINPAEVARAIAEAKRAAG